LCEKRDKCYNCMSGYTLNSMFVVCVWRLYSRLRLPTVQHFISMRNWDSCETNVCFDIIWTASMHFDWNCGWSRTLYETLPNSYKPGVADCASIVEKYICIDCYIPFIFIHNHFVCSCNSFTAKFCSRWLGGVTCCTVLRLVLTFSSKTCGISALLVLCFSHAVTFYHSPFHW